MTRKYFLKHKIKEVTTPFNTTFTSKQIAETHLENWARDIYNSAPFIDSDEEFCVWMHNTKFSNKVEAVIKSLDNAKSHNGIGEIYINFAGYVVCTAALLDNVEFHLYRMFKISYYMVP